MKLKSGFIQNPLSNTRGDSIQALFLIKKIEKQAHNGCGLHYEIYMNRIYHEVCDLLALLNEDDKEKLKNAARSRGIHITDESISENNKAYCDLLIELEKEQL